MILPSRVRARHERTISPGRMDCYMCSMIIIPNVRRQRSAYARLFLMPPTDTISALLIEAVRLLRESGRHFKSRQVAEARRLIEQAIKQMEQRP